MAIPTPTSVSGSSVVEVCRWSRLHSVSPCRTSQSSCATSLIRTLWHVPACHARAHDLVAGARAAGRCRRLRRPGPAVHQPHHPAADAPGHLGPRRGRPVPAAADDGAAGRCGLAGRRGAGEALAQRRGAARRAPRRRGGGAGAGHRPDVRGLRRRTRGVRRGAGAGRRRRQHAGGRGGARLRPADPAVVPRRLDGRRRGRRRAHAGRPRPLAGRRARGGARRGGAGRPVPAAGRRARHRRRGGAVAADRAGRPGDGALLHGRHRGDHVGTDVPRQHVPDAGPAGGAGDVPLPPGHAGDAAGRRRPGRPVRAGAGAPGRRGGRLGVAVRDRHRAQLAGGGRGLHPARPRRRGDRAAELLRGRPDRRRPGGPGGDPAGPGRRGDRPVQPVQLRRRAARRGAHRPGRRGLAARRVRRTDGAGAVHPAAGEELRSRYPVPRSPSALAPGQFLSGWGTGRPGCSPPRASR